MFTENRDPKHAIRSLISDTPVTKSVWHRCDLEINQGHSKWYEGVTLNEYYHVVCIEKIAMLNFLGQIRAIGQLAVLTLIIT